MLWHYEYHKFDENHKGQITCFDFAQSLFVYYFPFHLVDTYLDHFSEFKHHKDTYITVQQYCAFQYFLKQRAKIVEIVMTKGKIDFNNLRDLVDEFEEEDEYCIKHEVHISDNMLKAFLDAMDLDGNGTLEAEEVVGILKSKKLIGSGTLQKGKK